MNQNCLWGELKLLNLYILMRIRFPVRFNLSPPKKKLLKTHEEKDANFQQPTNQLSTVEYERPTIFCLKRNVDLFGSMHLWRIVFGVKNALQPFFGVRILLPTYLYNLENSLKNMCIFLTFHLMWRLRLLKGHTGYLYDFPKKRTEMNSSYSCVANHTTGQPNPPKATPQQNES